MSARHIFLSLPLLFGMAAVSSAQDAKHELYAARYSSAADLYAKRISEAPGDGEAYYGLVRALLKAHRAEEAFAAADKGARLTPQTAATRTACGLAAFRHGDIAQAQTDFRDALKIDSNYPGALAGLASVYSTISKFKTARTLLIRASAQAPDDPDFLPAYHNSTGAAERIAQMQRLLDAVDPASDLARSLGARIATARALGDRPVRKLTSPYAPTRIKLIRIQDGPRHLTRGFGVRVQINGKYTVTLLLDTGASGIAISPRAAEKAGLIRLGDAAAEAKGIGDGKSQDEFSYLASEVRAGDVAFADYPVSAFRSAKDDDSDGLIGADVFRQFIVALDFPNAEIRLEPRAEGPQSGSDPVDAADTPAPGFHRVFRFSDHLVVPATLNDKAGLLLLDTGSSSNLVDTAAAKAAARVHGDSSTVVRGIQGKVDQVSRADSVSLVFAGFRQDNPELLAIDMTKTSDGLGVGLSGIVGMPVLGQLKMTVDYREGTVRLDYTPR
jgi:tetratricopeptide (TPR) repeat protein